MRRAFTIIALFFSCSSLFAQDADTSNVYKNEFGIDATSFLRAVIPIFGEQVNSYEYYVPTYYLTYRRLFKPGNLRCALGGDVSRRELPSTQIDDPETYYKKSNSIDSRIGWEFKTELGKRWQGLYGIDFRASFSYSLNEFQYSNAGYIRGYERSTQTYGFGPILGFRFKLNDRISLLTEVNFSFNVMQTDSKTLYTALPGFPEKQNDADPITTDYFTNFNQPVSIFFAFNF